MYVLRTYISEPIFKKNYEKMKKLFIIFSIFNKISQKKKDD